MPVVPPRCIAFDMEGPLTSQDAAFELMGLVPGGHQVFQAVSRYDDILALSGRPDYEPGDTLALIVPFLLYHRLSAFHIQRLAESAPIVDGAKDVIARLSADGYEVFSITTTYEQYAQRVARRLRLALTRLACTSFPLEKFSARLRTADMSAVANIESALRRLDVEKEEERLGELLDAFYWQELPGSPMGEAVASVRPVGGKRKLGALGRFAAATQLDLSDWVVVGDSITDNAMLTGVRDATGLSVAFNANRYALECGTVGVASTSLGDLVPLLRAWEKGRLEGVRDFVSRAAKDPEAPGPHYHWLDSADIADAVAVHGRFRRLVREDAAGLG